MAFVLRGNTASFYINGELKNSGSVCSYTLYQVIPRYVTRSLNYIGQSQYNLANLNAVLSDFKIYKGALLSTDISSQFNELCLFYFFLYNSKINFIVLFNIA